MAARPPKPSRERCDQLAAVMAELVASAGAARFLMAPVAPGRAAFPEPWAPTLGGVSAVLRRLAWHAGEGRAIVLADERVGAPPTERKPQTSVEALVVRKADIVFAVRFVGEDDVAGTLAHELGVAFAAAHRPSDASPYREAPTGATGATDIEVDPHRDFARGSLATVYLGLGVLAANAAFQEYSRSRGAYQPLEYDVLHAGYAPLPELAYLLAVQAVARGEAQPPPGLVGAARDETAAWIAALLPERTALRAALGIAADATGPLRPAVVELGDVDVALGPPLKNAFRWQAQRTGIGTIAGAVLAAGVGLLVGGRAIPEVIFVAGATAGYSVGRRVRVARCSACVSVVALTAETCRHCGASLRGDIASMADRLEAEEKLAEGLADGLPEAESTDSAHPPAA